MKVGRCIMCGGDLIEIDSVEKKAEMFKCVKCGGVNSVFVWVNSTTVKQA